jgi:hypothetical protein
MTPKHKRAHDILKAVSAVSPYKNKDQNLHYQWVLGYVAGALSDALEHDSRALSKFIKRLNK